MTAIKLQDIDELARVVVAKRRSGEDISDIIALVKSQTSFIQNRIKVALDRETFRNR